MSSCRTCLAAVVPALLLASGCSESSPGGGEQSLVGEWKCRGTQTQGWYKYDVGEDATVTEDSITLSICDDPIDLTGDPNEELVFTDADCDRAGHGQEINEGWFAWEDSEQPVLYFNFTWPGVGTYDTTLDCERR